MRIPSSLLSLVDLGMIDQVLRPLMSGKEAQLYMVVAGGEERVAKVYKEASQRSFKQRSDYTEGRKVRNSRDRRAMNKRSRYGRSQEEEAWRNAEVDMIYRLRTAGVRVPVPHGFMDGVLVMELIRGSDGLPAPRLGDIEFEGEEARQVYTKVIQEVIRMLCAGVVHGDLSDLNILMSEDGPVLIDFPQAVDPAQNSSARRLLLRDVENMHNFLARFKRHGHFPYAQEMWDLYEKNELVPETILRGNFRDQRRRANTKEVLNLIGDAEKEHTRDQLRRQGQGQHQPEVRQRNQDGRSRTRVESEPRDEAPRRRRRRN